MNAFASKASVVYAGLLCASSAMACDLAVNGAWIRQPPPGATTLAAYATLANTGKSPLRIADISSPTAGMAMLHETRREGGMAQMLAIDSLKIPVGGKVELAPLGKHIMLMDLQGLPRVGDRIAISFKDGTGCTTSASFVVQPLDATGPESRSAAAADEMKNMPGM